ncbi:MAG: translational machinery protein [Proteobacteria bacterium]|nr:translational machinery protein [Pseudomonadota bacterium]
MPQHFHAVVWIDHHAARILQFNAADFDLDVIHPLHPPRHIHHKAGSRTGARAPEDQPFYQEVAEALGDVGAFLIVGPSNAKVELIKHMHRFNPGLIDRLAAVETADHPSDGELVDHARRVFGPIDRTTPQLARRSS